MSKRVNPPPVLIADSPFNGEFYQKIVWFARVLKEWCAFAIMHFDEMDALIARVLQSPSCDIQIQTFRDSAGPSRRLINRLMAFYHRSNRYLQVARVLFAMNSNTLR
jgi:hypothetical protein